SFVEVQASERRWTDGRRSRKWVVISCTTSGAICSSGSATRSSAGPTWWPPCRTNGEEHTAQISKPPFHQENQGRCVQRRIRGRGAIRIGHIRCVVGALLCRPHSTVEQPRILRLAGSAKPSSVSAQPLHEDLRAVAMPDALRVDHPVAT